MDFFFFAVCLHGTFSPGIEPSQPLTIQRSFSFIKIFTLDHQKDDEEDDAKRGRFIWEIRAGNFLDVILQFPPNGVSQLFLLFVNLN